jgi:hypothetical protein
LSFAPYSGVDGYYIERAAKTGDTVGAWQELALTRDCSWEDNVANGEEYCYQAYTIATLPNGVQTQSAASDMICDSAAPNATYTAAITDGEVKLSSATYADPAEGAPSGAAEVSFLLDPDGDPSTDDAVPILFGQIQDGSLAYLNPATGALVLDLDYLGQPSEFIATLLAHEALHRIWDQDWTNYTSGAIPAPLYGNNPDGTIRHEYSYYNEYSAFTTNAMAWRSFFPNTFTGNSEKEAFKSTLDATGLKLYNNMEAAVNYFLGYKDQRLPFPSGKPSGLATSDQGYGLNVLEILTTVYGYDIDYDY